MMLLLVYTENNHADKQINILITVEERNPNYSMFRKPSEMYFLILYILGIVSPGILIIMH